MAQFDEFTMRSGSVPPTAMKRSGFESLARFAKRLEVKKKQLIYVPGDPGDAVYFLKAGRVKISNCAESGKEFTFSILRAGDVFGEVEALEGIPRETAAEALDDSVLGVVPRDLFLGHLKEHPEQSLAITKLIGARMRQLQNRVEDLVFKDVATRLAHLLRELGETTPGAGGPDPHTCARLTHQELANLIGCNRETVSAILGQFREQGLIRLGRRSVTILEMDRVSRFVA